MGTNFTARYALRKWECECWRIHGDPFIRDHGKKSLNRRKKLRRWAKSLRRRGERIIAPLIIED